MATSTRAAMSGLSSRSRWLRKRETVALETPAASATSAMVARPLGFMRGSRSLSPWGEGWGEGPRRWRGQRPHGGRRPHPNPLPLGRGEGARQVTLMRSPCRTAPSASRPPAPAAGSSSPAPPSHGAFRCVAEPMCGSGVTRGCVRSGDSAGSGSFANTSSPAARKRAMVERLQQRLFVHCGTAAPVDERSARLHAREEARIDHAARGVRHRQHRQHDVGARQQVVQRRVRGTALQLGRLRGQVDRAARVVQHRHAEAQRGAARHGLADAAEARGCPASCRARRCRTAPRRCSWSSGLRAPGSTAPPRGVAWPSRSRTPCRPPSRSARRACGTARCRAGAARPARSCRHRPTRSKSPGAAAPCRAARHRRCSSSR
jgi:hypothetical protein